MNEAACCKKRIVFSVFVPVIIPPLPGLSDEKRMKLTAELGCKVFIRLLPTHYQV